MQFDELAVLVKPASGLCNLACTYCIYRDAAHTRGIMPDATVQALLENVFAHTRRSVTFAFQGGEPTLAGLDFYRRFVERVEAQRSADMTVSYALQTNGIALDEAWASFLAENRFLVGLSVDGTASIHDKYRQTPNGAGTYLQVRQAAEAAGTGDGLRPAPGQQAGAQVENALVGAVPEVEQVHGDTSFRFPYYGGYAEFLQEKGAAAPPLGNAIYYSTASMRP